MLKLDNLYCFVQVVDNKGFTAAARAVDQPKSTLSRRVMELEAELGARLIHRTSRHFAVTDAGQEFYEHALAAVIEAEAAEEAIRRRHSEAVGVVRFSCSSTVAQFALAALLPDFARRFPKVCVVQHATNRFVDPLGENFDVVIRAHTDPLPDSSLVQRGLLFSPRWLVASPDYLQRHGKPRTPEELGGHTGLAYGNAVTETAWRLQRHADKNISVHFTSALVSDDLTTLLEAAKAGLGVVSLPAFMCRGEIEMRRLQRVLPAWTTGGAHITALMPSRRHLLPSVRAFVDFLSRDLPAAMLGGVGHHDRISSPAVD